MINTSTDPASPQYEVNWYVSQVTLNGAGTSPVIASSANGSTPRNVRLGGELMVGAGTNQSGKLTIDPGLDTLSSGNTESPVPITPDQTSFTVRSPFRIGDDAGTGEVIWNTGSGFAISVVNGYPGIGTQKGVGSLSILGDGKSAGDVMMGAKSVDWYATNMGQGLEAFRVGVDGAGTVTLNGAGLGVAANDSQGSRNSLSLLQNGKLVIGSGLDSVGKLDVLGGGKLAVWARGAESSDTVFTSNLTRVGVDNGVGSIQIGAKSANGIYNRANISYGMSLGTAGGAGELEVLSEGKAWVHKPVSLGSLPGCPASVYLDRIAPLLIGDGSADGTGKNKQSWVRVNGANANLLVSGKVADPTFGAMPVRPGNIGRIEIGSRGGLVAGEGGLIQVGAAGQSQSAKDRSDPTNPLPVYGVSSLVSRLGPVQVLGSGGVYYGSEVAGVPKATGTIEASQIELNSADAKLVFNHTDSLFTLDTPVVGTGQLLQTAGTTVLVSAVKSGPAADADPWTLEPEYDPSGQAVCLPSVIRTQTNQLGFAGTVAVTGGSLVLSENDVIKNATAFNVNTSGTLVMSGTTQSLNDVTLADQGVLRLAGAKLDGTPAAATDVAHANNWSGGGTVELDTVLGTNGSPSDKLVIAGSISGTTKLKINVVGGTGAATTGGVGILVVEGPSGGGVSRLAKAGATDPQFELLGPVSDNGVVYTLKQVGANWYLVSQAGPVTPTIGQVIDDVGPSKSDLSQGGTVNSATTDDTIPTVKGSGATPNSTITLYSGGVNVGTATVDSSGNWSVDPTTALTPGPHVLTVTESIGGVESQPSSPFTVTIDTGSGAGGLPAPTVTQVIDDTGATPVDLSKGNTVTSATTTDTTPTVKGGGATPGATITLYDNGKPVGTSTADAAGNWSVTPTIPLASGPHPLTVTQKTAQQPEGAISGVFTVTINGGGGVAASAVSVPSLGGGALAGLIAMMGIASAFVRRRKHKPE